MAADEQATYNICEGESELIKNFVVCPTHFVINTQFEMPFTDDWKSCYIVNRSTCGEAELKFEELVAGLSYFEAICVCLAIFMYIVTMVHLAVVDKLQELPVVIQFQTCLVLLLNHVALGLGFLLSPCKPWSIDNEDLFVDVCIGLSAVQLGTFVSVFSWKLVEVVYIQLLISKVVQLLDFFFDF